MTTPHWTLPLDTSSLSLPQSSHLSLKLCMSLHLSLQPLPRSSPSLYLYLPLICISFSNHFAFKRTSLRSQFYSLLIFKSRINTFRLSYFVNALLSGTNYRLIFCNHHPCPLLNLVSAKRCWFKLSRQLACAWAWGPEQCLLSIPTIARMSSLDMAFIQCSSCAATLLLSTGSSTAAAKMVVLCSMKARSVMGGRGCEPINLRTSPVKHNHYLQLYGHDRTRFDWFYICIIRIAERALSYTVHFCMCD